MYTHLLPWPPLREQVRLVDEDDYVAERRVMAAVYGPGKPATTFVMLDPAGNLVDFLHCPQFSGHIPRQRAAPGEVYNMFADPKKVGGWGLFVVRGV